MKKRYTKPPRLAARLLRLFLNREKAILLEGDFEEIFRDKVSEKGKISAYFWYWGQVLLSLPSVLFFSIYWSLNMFGNYFKVAFRIIKRNKIYSFLSTLSLTVGMAIFLLIILYNQYELSYDSHNEHADRIFRIAVDLEGLYIQADTPAVLAPTIVEEIPEVASVVRLRRRNAIVANQMNKFIENSLFSSDPNIFDIFTFQLIHGEKESAMLNPKSIVLSEKMADKYFGEKNPIGKTLSVNNSADYYVSGVFKDFPKNSHLNIEFIIPKTEYFLNWSSSNVYTYCMLNEKADPKTAETKINDLIEKRINTGGEKTKISRFILQPLQSIHLHSDLMNELSSNSKVEYLYIISVIAIIILIISCINYINLAVGRSFSRIREVALREVLGAKRRQIILQFFSESIILSILSMAIAVLIARVVTPGLNSFAGTDISFELFNNKSILTVLLLTVSVCLFGGGYPAIYMSAFRKSIIQKNALKSGRKNNFVRNVLVVFQFTISIALIISILVIESQMNFIKNKDMGFDKNGIVILRIRGENARNNFNIIKTELLKHPDILYASRSTELPVNVNGAQKMRIPAGVPVPENRPLFYRVGTDFDFLNVYNIKLVNGRSFSKDFPSDLNGALIFNEAAVKYTGWDTPLGKEYEVNGDKLPVIGEVKDFNIHSLHTSIKPFYFYFSPNSGSYLSVKISDSNKTETIAYIENVMKTYSPDFSFEYRYLSEIIDDLYLTEQKMESVFRLSAILAIIIACTGLLGLSLYTVEQSKKEIGIRKVMGASIFNIVLWLSKDFTKWILLANIFAWPIGYFAMDKWLDSFTYKVDSGFILYISAGCITLMIALLTIFIQTIKAAGANPVESIRYE